MIYSPPFEPYSTERTPGWDKETVKYMMKHSGKVRATINKMAYSVKRSYVSPEDIDEMYGYALLYFYKNEDYRLEKAYTNRGMSSLTNYINKCINGVVLQFLSGALEWETKTEHERSKDEDTLFRNISDEKDDYEDIGNDLRDSLEANMYRRYKCGVDIYLVILIGLTLRELSKVNLRNYVYSIYCIDEVQIDKIRKLNDELSEVIAADVEGMPPWEAIDIITEYVYGGKQIVDRICSL